MDNNKHQIEQRIDELVMAITNKNWDKADRIYAEGYTLFESGNEMSWGEQKRMFKEHIRDHNIETSTRDLHVSDDGNMAWCTLNEDTTYTMEGENVEQHTLVTTIWEKKDNDWKLTHFNRSVDPATIPEAQRAVMA